MENMVMENIENMETAEKNDIMNRLGIVNVNDKQWHTVYSEKENAIINCVNPETRTTLITALNTTIFNDFVAAINATENPAACYLFNAQHYSAKYSEKTKKITYNPVKESNILFQ